MVCREETGNAGENNQLCGVHTKIGFWGGLSGSENRATLILVPEQKGEREIRGREGDDEWKVLLTCRTE